VNDGRIREVAWSYAGSKFVNETGTAHRACTWGARMPGNDVVDRDREVARVVGDRRLTITCPASGERVDAVR